jgi:hypothetical protein
VDRVIDRLEFLGALAEFWRITATFSLGVSTHPSKKAKKLNESKQKDLNRRRELFQSWLTQAIQFRSQLFELLDSVNRYDLPASGVDAESMVTYDRHRLYKESLTQNVIAACTQIEVAIRMLGSSTTAIDWILDPGGERPVDERLADLRPLVMIFAAAMVQDQNRLIDEFPALNDYLRNSRLLYVPLSRGGSPREIVQFRAVQSAIRELLATLPFLGLIGESYELTQMAMTLERNMPIDQGAVTEFDELFRVAYSSMVEAIVCASKKNQPTPKRKKTTAAERQKIEAHQDLLFQCIQDLTDSMLMIWLNHSRTLRLSVLERVMDRNAWQALVKFITAYGRELFTQEFLQLSNVRAILHQGVDEWLYKMQRSNLAERPRLIDEIGGRVSLRQAVDFLTMILEAIIENYPRYRDYNGTTTLSDHGEMLYVFLDFLRLERRYDRISWHLKPVIWAHEILVRNEEADVAQDWRRSLMERVSGEASRYLGQLTRLRKKYSIQMASIGQHLEGRFVKPMWIDRLVAMVGDAMADPDDINSQSVFDMLKFECDTMVKMSQGVGIDVPDWLSALEDEVELLTVHERFKYDPSKPRPLVKSDQLDMKNLIEQVDTFPKYGDTSEESEDDASE